MPKNVLTRIKDTKIRTLLILGILVAMGLMLILYFSLRQPEPKVAEESVTSKVPDISSVPGGATSERYQQLLEEENRKRAEAARQSGTSAIATIIGAKKKEGSETFGIEGQLLAAQQQCSCPPSGTESEIPDLDPLRAAELIAELREHPERALTLLTQNRGLGKALCKQDKELAYQTLERTPETAKILLSECPDLAKTLAEKNPGLFKKLMLDNPELARQLAQKNPDLFKKMIQADPAFAKQLADSNPDLFKPLMKNDLEFAKQMTITNPDLVKTLMKNDPEFTKQLAVANPDIMTSLMKNDPDFAKQLATTNPDLLKALMKNNPEFVKQLAATNPELIKTLMKNDPEFAKQMAAVNPTLVKNLMLSDPDFAKIMAINTPDMVKELIRNDPEFTKMLAQKNPSVIAMVQGQSGLSTQANRDRAQEEARRRAQQEASQSKLLTEQQQKQKQNLSTRMDNQAKSIFQAWNEFTQQTLVQGEAAEKKEGKAGTAGAGSGSGSGGATATASASAGPLFKAGTILFAVLDTAVNSDEPGPVMATIIEGPYRGAKLIGTMTTTSQPGSQPPEKVTLNFNQMNMSDRPATLPIQAVAIDPDTARTAIASDVDHHYLLRYGTLFISSLASGYAKTITSQGSVQTTATNGLATTTTMPQLNNTKTIFAALGEVGNKFGQATASWFNTPPTITVDAGTGVGILFLSDVTG